MLSLQFQALAFLFTAKSTLPIGLAHHFPVTACHATELMFYNVSPAKEWRSPAAPCPPWSSSSSSLNLDDDFNADELLEHKEKEFSESIVFEREGKRYLLSAGRVDHCVLTLEKGATASPWILSLQPKSSAWSTSTERAKTTTRRSGRRSRSSTSTATASSPPPSHRSVVAFEQPPLVPQALDLGQQWTEMKPTVQPITEL